MNLYICPERNCGDLRCPHRSPHPENDNWFADCPACIPYDLPDRMAAALREASKTITCLANYNGFSTPQVVVSEIEALLREWEEQK